MTKLNPIVKLCELAQREHGESKRQYAHVFHRDNVICVCFDFLTVPKHYRQGIIWHEIGHLLVGPEGSEQDANEAVYQEFGIRIKYRNSKYGKNLEFV